MIHDDSLLKKNLLSLKNHFPHLESRLQEVRKTTPHPPKELEVLSTKEGPLSLSWKGQSLHSRYSPNQEARTLYQKLKGDSSHFILIQSGLNYLGDEILSDRRPFLWIERDLPLFLYTLALRDMTHFFESDYLSLLLSPSLEELEEVLEEDFITTTKIYLNPVFQKEERYLQFKEEIERVLEKRKIRRFTQLRFQQRWFTNILKNGHHLSPQRDIESYSNLFKGLSALIIAAGPSLRDELPHLKTYQERFILICVDTAYHLLHKEGIIPDLIVSVDTQYWNSRHLDRLRNFQSENQKAPILLTNLTINSSFLHSYSLSSKQRTLFARIGFSLESYLAPGKIHSAPLKSGGSVTTAAYEYARLLGFESLYFVGMDMGFPNRQTHATGSFFEERAGWIQSRFFPLSQQNYLYLHDGLLSLRQNHSGQPVLSDRRMQIYIEWFERRAKESGSPSLYTLSQQGVKIEGVPLVERDSLLEFPKIERERRECMSLLEKSLGQPREREKEVEKLKRSLLKEIESLEKPIAQLLSLLSRPIESEEFHSRLKECESQIRNTPIKEIIGDILDPYMEQILSHEQESLDRYTKSRGLYRAMSQACVSLREWLINTLPPTLPRSH